MFPGVSTFRVHRKKQYGAFRWNHIDIRTSLESSILWWTGPGLERSILTCVEQRHNVNTSTVHAVLSRRYVQYKRLIFANQILSLLQYLQGSLKALLENP